MSRLRKLHFASLLVSLLLFGAMSVTVAFPILDTKWCIESQEVYRMLAELGSLQLQSYRTMLALDFGYALAYPLFLVLTLRLITVEKLGKPRLFPALSLVPLTAGICDAVENASILAIMHALPGTSPLAESLGIFTSAKWLAVALTFTMLLALWAWSILAKAKPSRSVGAQEPDRTTSTNQ